MSGPKKKNNFIFICKTASLLD
jgi:hypothetical protein